MSSITIGDPEWEETFPNLVSPLQDEWLPGFLLRCDEANGWLSGTTESFVSLSHRMNLRGLPEAYIVAEHLDLEKLSQLLAVPLSALLETTFRPIICGLYGTLDTKTSRLITTDNHVYVCPTCIREARLLSISNALYHVTHCPNHKFALQQHCSCGASLRLFHRRTPPFTCFACGLDWATLPCIPVDSSRLAEETHYFSLYSFFLTNRTQLTYKRTLYWLYEERINWFFQPEVLFDGLGGLDDPQPYVVSLDYLIEDLVRLGFSVRDVALNTHSLSRKEVSCLNRGCPVYAVTDADYFALYGYYQVPLGDRVPIWCCKVCGSCWFNHRLCLTFDQNCTSDNPRILYPSPNTIRMAQERLSLWKGELQESCWRMIVRRQRITISQAFEEAHILLRPNLLALRLGLVQLIKGYAILQQYETIVELFSKQTYIYGSLT